MAIGTVARFDCRRGYGFVIPDDGGEDVFVHQNNIQMDGFRYLRAGERISYELEVGEKGMKAVQVQLLEPRREEPRDRRDGRDSRDNRDRRDRPPRHRHQPGAGGGRDAGADKVRRRLERLVNLLVEKGVLAPGELDGIEQEMEAADKAIGGGQDEAAASGADANEAETGDGQSAEATQDEYAQAD